MSVPRHAPAIVAAFALASVMAAAWPFTIDDAFIVGRYADRIARGLGYTFDDGEPSDGVTGPLWLALLALGARAGLDPVSVGKWAGAAASALAVIAVVERLRRRALGRVSAWIAAFTALSSLPLVIWSGAGLETGLATLCATALWLAVTSRPRPRALLAGSASAALAWLRPELAAFVVAALAVLALRGWRRATPALALALLGGVGVLAFRLTLFGHALPMSASAKPALLEQGASYVTAALARPRSWFAVLAVLAAVRLAPRQGVALGLALAVHVAGVTLAGGDWMPGRRLFVPVLPVLALAAALGLSRLALRRPWLARGLFGGLLASGCFELVPELRAAREAGLARAPRSAELARLVCAAPGPVVAVDIGLLGYLCREQSFVDLGGLTEPALAYAPGGHLDKHVDGAWLRAHAPGLVVLHSRERPRLDERERVRWFAGYAVERRVLALPFVQREYAATHVLEYAPHYFYVLLARRDDSPR